MGIGTTGTVGDGDKFLSPCSCLWHGTPIGTCPCEQCGLRRESQFARNVHHTDAWHGVSVSTHYSRFDNRGCTTGWVNCANEPSQAALERSSHDAYDVIRLTRSKADVWTVDDVARLIDFFRKHSYLFVYFTVGNI